MSDSSVLGLKEIAALLEVKPRTPHAWAFRKILPSANFDSVNGSKAWKRQTIIDWAYLSDRLPNQYVGEVSKRALRSAE